MKKKKYKLSRKGKQFLGYNFLFILDLIFLFNAPNIIRKVDTINDYRFNMLIYFSLFLINIVTIIKMEEK